MALGILEPSPSVSDGPNTHHHPTGTVPLESLSPVTTTAATSTNKSTVILVPHPSSSPSDPLNLAPHRKTLLFLTLLLGASLAGVTGPLLTPAYSVVASSFGVPLRDMVVQTGAFTMTIGVSSYLCTCLVAGGLVGKRVVYLGTTGAVLVGCCWGAGAGGYGSLFGARVLQGLGMGSYFALAPTATISDVFFVHERGLRGGLWNLSLIAAANITPIISGYVIVELSWRWAFGLLAILYGVQLFCVVLFLPETTFERGEDGLGREGGGLREEGKEGGRKTLGDALEERKIDHGSLSPTNTPSKHNTTTTANALPLWRRILNLPPAPLPLHPHPSPLRLLTSPFPLLRHPSILWITCVWSTCFALIILQGAVGQQIFSAPPYNLPPTSIGVLIGVAPLIGAALGTVAGGKACDVAARGMARRNRGGLFEPEFRLLVIGPAVVAVLVGGFGLGVAVEKGLSTGVCAVFLGVWNFGAGCGCSVVVAYTNDVCRERKGEVFGLTILIKSAYVFGLSFILNAYYTTHGPLIFFATWTCLAAFFMSLAAPLYVFGKRVRAWSDGRGIL